VARAISESGGVDVIAESPNIGGREADLAIWSDALQPLVGNPLLIEIKLAVRPEDAHRAVQQFSATIRSSGARWGLFLYGEGPESKKAWKSVPPNVLVMAVHMLFREMETRPFVDIIKDQRNRRVHGALP
jgi:hypothetical protein